MEDMNWFLFLVVSAVLVLSGGIVVSTHIQKMECIKARGEWVDRACRFTK